MFENLEEVVLKYREIEEKLAQPEVTSKQTEYVRLSKEHASLADLVETYLKFRKSSQETEENQVLLEDADAGVRELAREEMARLNEEIKSLTERLIVLLIPKDPYDEKNIILEIRAGTGGEEASLFAAVLFRMYARYAERRRWKMEILSKNETGLGGLKEIVCSVSGDKVYSRLKFESGVHRVQRVPETEAQGRIHTSAVTVAVLPEPDEVEAIINDKDLKIDVYRSSGPGGQSVNTTDSAVRVTHLPSGLVVTIQDEKSQHKNKAKALKVLQARLLDRQIAEQQAAISAERKSLVGSGDRSERIRTYNFPQNRLTDHRIGLTLYQLDTLIDGDLDSVVEPLMAHMQAEAIGGSQGEGNNQLRMTNDE
jgi:peptide chain release factor 1